MSEPSEATLNIADPLIQPNINVDFFADDLDITAMPESVRFSYDVLTKGDDFKDIVATECPWDMPLHSDEGMKIVILDHCQTAFQPCGTASRPKT